MLIKAASTQRREELEHWLRRAFIAGYVSAGGEATEDVGHLAQTKAIKLVREWVASHGN
jgi:hypothetical protein